MSVAAEHKMGEVDFGKNKGGVRFGANWDSASATINTPIASYIIGSTNYYDSKSKFVDALMNKYIERMRQYKLKDK